MISLTADNMEIVFFAGVAFVLMLANIIVVIKVFRLNRSNDDHDKGRLVCTGCEIIAGVCNINFWMTFFVFFLIYDSHSPKSERWAHCRGFNTVLQIVSCIYNICLCQTLLCKPLQYFRHVKETFTSTLFRNAIFVLMPVIIGVYWFISVLLSRFHRTQTYEAQAAILDLPEYETVVLDLGNTTTRSPGSVVVVDCLPSNDCVVVPESLTLCPERVYVWTDLVFDYLILVLPISVPILWAWTKEEKGANRDEESCQLDQQKDAGTICSSQVVAHHELRCLYKKAETFVSFLLKMNFQWQFVLRPLLLILCILKGRAYFLDIGNKMVVTWIVAFVPLMTIFGEYFRGEGKERRGTRCEKNGSFSSEVGCNSNEAKGVFFPLAEVDFMMTGDEAPKKKRNLDSIQFPQA